MVETFGANRGLTPTISKGVKRSNIRYNANDQINGNNNSSKNTKKSYREKTITRIKDLEFYLGKDWIDWSACKVAINNKSRFGTRNNNPSIPMFCDKCNRPFETRAFEGGRVIGNKILPKNVFKRVPLVRGDCGMCNG
jgi:hypothetical protein|tara:strand:+ start:353 stop:766 length:414 start_codon:yes stop_codon:yes gene_type:complete